MFIVFKAKMLFRFTLLDIYFVSDCYDFWYGCGSYVFSNTLVTPDALMLNEDTSDISYTNCMMRSNFDNLLCYTIFNFWKCRNVGNVGSWYIDGICKLLVEAGSFSSMDLVMNIRMVWTDDEKSLVNIENNQA